MRITFRNHSLATSAAVYVGRDGVLNKRQVEGLRARLAPAGLAGAGYLGEDGPQTPPEAPGFLYEVQPLEDGGARLVPRPIRPDATAASAAD